MLSKNAATLCLFDIVVYIRLMCDRPLGSFGYCVKGSTILLLILSLATLSVISYPKMYVYICHLYSSSAALYP